MVKNVYIHLYRVCHFDINHKTLVMEVVISSDSEFSILGWILGWIMVVTAAVFVVLLLIVFVDAIMTYFSQTLEEANNFVEEEINRNHESD